MEVLIPLGIISTTKATDAVITRIVAFLKQFNYIENKLLKIKVMPAVVLINNKYNIFVGNLYILCREIL